MLGYVSWPVAVQLLIPLVLRVLLLPLQLLIAAQSTKLLRLLFMQGGSYEAPVIG